MMKKGQSLVEVTVALSILAVVMMGIITLGINVIGYSINAKAQTQGIGLAQQGLEQTRANGGCGRNPGILENNNKITLGNSDFYRTIDVKSGDDPGLSGLTIVPAGNQASDYWYVTSTVYWDVHGSPVGQSTTVYGLVSKKD